jgi:hypothetical protein
MQRVDVFARYRLFRWWLTPAKAGFWSGDRVITAPGLPACVVVLMKCYLSLVDGLCRSRATATNNPRVMLRCVAGWLPGHLKSGAFTCQPENKSTTLTIKNFTHLHPHRV